MRRREAKKDLSNGPYRLYLDDVRDIVALLKEHGDEIRISTEHHHLDSFDEFRNLDDPVGELEIDVYREQEPIPDLPDWKPQPEAVFSVRIGPRMAYYWGSRLKQSEAQVVLALEAILVPRRRSRLAHFFERPTVIHPYPRRERKSFWREHWPSIALHAINTVIALGLGYLLARLTSH